MRSFTHQMPGEKQSCVGCHANRNYATTPSHVGRPTAALRTPQDLEPPEWGAVPFDYASIVQPVLDQYCVECHDARQTPHLHLDRSECALLRHRGYGSSGTAGLPQNHTTRSQAGHGRCIPTALCVLPHKQAGEDTYGLASTWTTGQVGRSRIARRKSPLEQLSAGPLGHRSRGHWRLW